MTYYSKKANAKRAAKAARVDLEAVRFFETSHGWTWAPIASEPAELDDYARDADREPDPYAGDECPNAAKVEPAVEEAAPSSEAERPYWRQLPACGMMMRKSE